MCEERLLSKHDYELSARTLLNAIGYADRTADVQYAPAPYVALYFYMFLSHSLI